MRIIIFTLLISNLSLAKSRLLEIRYQSKMFAHIHENPSKTSASLTTLPCGYPVKIYSKKGLDKDADWKFVKAGDDFGFIHLDHLSSKRPKCFQGKYPKFFTGVELDLSELYYWGKLYDQFLVEKSHAN